MEKDKWIEKIIYSTNGISKAIPNEQLFSKIELKIQNEYRSETNTKWLVAASIVILLSLNATLFVKEINNFKKHDLIELIPTVNNQLY